MKRRLVYSRHRMTSLNEVIIILYLFLLFILNEYPPRKSEYANDFYKIFVKFMFMFVDLQGI